MIEGFVQVAKDYSFSFIFCCYLVATPYQIARLGRKFNDMYENVKHSKRIDTTRISELECLLEKSRDISAKNYLWDQFESGNVKFLIDYPQYIDSKTVLNDYIDSNIERKDRSIVVSLKVAEKEEIKCFI